MSGGSYCYMFNRIEEEYVGRMYDSQLNAMMKDLVDLLHDLEWWQSCDYGEDTYRKTVAEFKKNGLNKQRLMFKSKSNQSLNKQKINY